MMNTLRETSQLQQTVAKFAAIQPELTKLRSSVSVTYRDGVFDFTISRRLVITGIVLPFLFCTGWVVLGTWYISLSIPLLSPFLPLTALCGGLLLLWIKLRYFAPPLPLFARWNANTSELTVYDVDTLNQQRTIAKAPEIEQLEIWHMRQGDELHSALYLIDRKEEQTVLLRELSNPDYINSMGMIFGYLLDKPVFRRNENGEMEWLPERLP